MLLLSLWCTAFNSFASEGKPVHSSDGFIRNLGQWNNPFSFVLPLQHAQVYAETNALQYFFEDAQQVGNYVNHSLNPHLFKSATINMHAVRMEFLLSNTKTTVSGQHKLAHHFNYFVGSNPKLWKSNVPIYQHLFYDELYNGIDMRLMHTENGNIKYEFYVAPGANTQLIKMHYKGLTKLQHKNNQLFFETTVNKWIENKPYAYQIINNKTIEISCNFRLDDNNTVSFDLGNYNPNYELIIDPLLVFSTYSGSSVDNFGHTASFDNSGNLFTAGVVRNPVLSDKYPVTQGAFQTVWGGGTGPFPWDIGISKYNNDGSALEYATYLGGNRNDYPVSIIVDEHNQLCLLGASLSTNFPTSTNAYDKTRSDTFDIVVTKFTANGSGIVGSTYIGGSGVDGLNVADSLRMNYADEFRGEILVDKKGEILIASSTSSSNLFTGIPSYQTNRSGLQDGIVVRFDSTLSTVKNYSYFGEAKHDALYSLDVDILGNVVVAGGTQNNNFAPSPGFEWANFRGGFADGIIVKFNPTLTTLVGMRYWGSSAYDQVYFVKLDPQQNITVMGQGFDSVSVTTGALNDTTGSLFVTKFSPALNQIIFSARIGNGGKRNALSPSAFMVDVCGSIYGSVWGGATNYQSRFAEIDRNPNTGQYRTFSSSTFTLPSVGTPLITAPDGSDFWLFSLNPNATAFQYASCFGESGGQDHVDGGTSRFDKRGIVYQSACASCASGKTGTFPTTSESFSPKNKSPRCSNASAKIDFRQGNILTAGFTIKPRNGCTDSIMLFENNSYNAQKNYWYINNVLVDSSINLTDTFTTVGTYTVKLVVLNNATCNPIDSLTKTFSIFPSSNAAFTLTMDTCSPVLKFTNLSTSNNNQPFAFTWHFGDGNTSKQLNPTHTYSLNGVYEILLITSENSQCADTAIRIINYDTSGFKLKANFTPSDVLRCEPTIFEIRNTSQNGDHFYWFVNDSLVSTNPQGFDSIAFKGQFKIKLLITDTSTCTKRDSIVREFSVFPETYTDFESAQDSCSLNVKFKNNSLIIPNDTVNYLWDFGDGQTSTETNPTHAYADTGTYTVKLTANPNFPCTHFREKTVTVIINNRILNARFIVEPTIICEPIAIKVTNQSLNQQKNYWYVNNVLIDSVNTNYNDTIKSISLTTIKLIVTATNTCLPSDTFSVLLQPESAVDADFVYKKDSCSNQFVFNNKSTTQSQNTPNYNWLFGDGNSSNLINPTHEFDTSGTYQVILIANPNTLCADTATTTVTFVKDQHLLSASFTFTDSLFCAPTFINATSNGINGKQFSWYLNNVFKQNNQTYTDTITTPGDYVLQLVVTDSLSCTITDTVTKTFTINPFAKAAFFILRDSCSLNVQFKNNAMPNGSKLIWYFGDGDSSDLSNPTHTYAGTANYTVTLIYNAGGPCADTLAQTFYIDGDSAQQLKIPNVFTPNGDGVNECFSVAGVNPKCDEYEIIVFNRWGLLVYKNTDGSACWDGTNQAGADIPDGVYYYIIRIKKKSGQNFKERGTVTIIRD